jgi:outer membrane protein
VRYSEVSRNQNKADYLPTLSASAGYNLGRNTQSNPSDKTYRSLSGALTSSINLFKGFEDRASLKKSEYTLAADKDTQTRTRQTVIFNTLKAYLETLSTKEKIRVAEQNLDDHQKQLEQIEAFCKAGRRPMTDLYQQQAETSSARLDLLTTRQDYHISLMSLKEMIGVSVLVPLDVTECLDDVESKKVVMSLDDLVREALEKRTDLYALKNTVWANEMAVKEATAGYYPTVDLVAELGTSWSSLDDTDRNEQWTNDNMDARVGLSVDIPIFDRYLTRSQVSQARISSRTAHYEYEKRQREIEVEIGQAYAEYQSAVSRVEVTAYQTAYAAKALESTQERYESGAATLTELTTARSAYVEARYNQVDADLTRIIQAMSLDFYRGNLDLIL